MTRRSDVTAVVLTMGEPTTARALASARHQTLPPAEIEVVAGTTPFSRALNVAASRVRTPFFVQVDADMILDFDCLTSLRERMAPGVGAAVGPLRDPLMGNICGVKLFRRACFETDQVPDSISCDMDFHARIERRGWEAPHVLNLGGGRGRAGTFGEHRPHYTPAYTYATYYLLGGRYRYLRDMRGLTWRLDRLRASRHPMALIALVAIGHGLFLLREDDVSKSFPPRADSKFLEGFLLTDGESSADHELELILTLPPLESFARAHELGAALGRGSACPALRRCIEILDEADTTAAWVTEVGLYHGLMSRDGPSCTSGSDREIVAGLLR